MKVGIVGAGMVGSAAAYAMALTGVASSIVLVDQNTALARAQAEDIAHAIPFASASVIAHGDYDRLKGAGVVIIAAGVGQKPGETRIDLLGRNVAVFQDVIGQVMLAAPDSILLIASNPVDIMTQVSLELSGLPPERVIGSGTILDTARFRSLLGTHLGIAPQSIHAYVLGEHGDSEVLSWSSARAGSTPINTFAAQVHAPLTNSLRAEIDAGVRNAAYTIIKGKGATWYGIGAGLSRIVHAIAQDQQAVLSVSALTRSVEGVQDITLSIPRVVGASGITAELFPDLDQSEHTALEKSAKVLKNTLTALQS